MRKIIFKNGNEKIIYFDDIDMCSPIFAKKNGELVGMVVKETRVRNHFSGWILRLGGNTGMGHYKSLKECLQAGLSEGYEFFVN